MNKNFFYISFFLITLIPVKLLAQEIKTPSKIPSPTSVNEKSTTSATTNAKITTDGTPSVVKATSDGTSVSTVVTKDGTTNGTINGTAVKKTVTTTDSTVTRTEKIVIKTVDPGFKLVPNVRLSPMGPNLVWAGIGIKAGLTDNSTGGFLTSFGYSYRLTRVMWVDTNIGFNFGGDCKAGSSESAGFQCGGLNGFGAQILGGILYNFLDQPKWNLPLNPYVRVLGGFSFIISNGPNDGVALVAKGAGGARYSFTDEFSVGAELGLTIGPSFRNVLGAGAFMAFDFLIHASYSF